MYNPYFLELALEQFQDPNATKTKLRSLSLRAN
jgi:hypothetical protein